MDTGGQNSFYNATNVEAAVTHFYCNGGANPDTHAWLTSAQMSQSAWVFAWQLLAPEKKPEVQFFGASTIALKVARFFEEIPNDQYAALRQRLLELLSGYTKQHIVRTRLCVALADLILRSIPEHWTNPISNIGTIFGGKSTSILLELLTVIPEEYSTLTVSTQKRAQIKAELTGSLHLVLPLIQQVINHSASKNVDNDDAIQAIKCFQAWIQFGIPMDEVVPLVKGLIDVTNNEELFDTAIDALNTLISHPMIDTYVNLLKQILHGILTLEPLLSQLVNEGSYEMASPLVSLFVTYGENHTPLLVSLATGGFAGQTVTDSEKELALRLIKLILGVSTIPAQYPTQETISEIPFGFWCVFQDEIVSSDPGKLQQCIQIFTPMYQTLVDSLLRKSIYNLKEQEWTKDQRETFRCYRTDIADTIMSSFNILKENLLNQLLKHLNTAAANVQENEHNWPYLEASLLMWSAVSQSLSEEEEECPIVSEFLAKLPSLPYNNNIKVIASALDCIGGFSEWFSMHPNLVTQLAPIVTSSLQNPELAVCATMALKDMCSDCTEGLKPYTQEVISACDAALKCNQLKASECVRLTYCIGKMLTLMPAHEVLPKLEPILMPYLAELQSLAAQNPKPESKSKLCFILKVLTTLFQTFKLANSLSNNLPESEIQDAQLQNPVVVLFPQIFPLVEQLAKKWISDVDVIEDMCDFLKECLSTLLDRIKPFINGIVMLLVECYEGVPHTCILELTQTIYVIFAKEDSMKELMQALFKTVIARSMKEITSTSNPSDHSDLIESFYENMAQVIKKVPGLVLTEGVNLIGVFTASIGCLGMPEDGPVHKSSQFLSHFIRASRDIAQLGTIMDQHGEALFLTTMRCIGGESSRTYTDYYVDILFALSKSYFDKLRQWLASMVGLHNFPTAHVNEELKRQYATLLLKERVNKRKIQEDTRKFSLACSGLPAVENDMKMSQVVAAWEKTGLEE